MKKIDTERKHFEGLYEIEREYLLDLQRKDIGNFTNKARSVKDRLCRIKNPKVLEIGCGFGSFTKLISDFDLYVCDVSEKALDYAKKISPEIKVFNMPAENLDFKDESFDAVVGCAILHHTDLGLALPQVERVLKSNGYFVFFEPNLSFPESYLIDKFQFFRRMSTNSQDECYFDKEFIYEELKKYKFKNIKVELYFSYHPKLPACLIPFNLFLNKIFKKLKFKYGARELFISGQKA